VKAGVGVYVGVKVGVGAGVGESEGLLKKKRPATTAVKRASTVK
jgi:hypothetical protein